VNILSVFHLVTQIDIIILSLLLTECQEGYNDLCRLVSPNGKHLLSKMYTRMILSDIILL